MTTPRTYRSDLREQQAERTRSLIADAARAAFLDKGWSGTSVRSVAATAGVSEGTVYAAYGSKAGLATSLIDAAERHAEVAQTITELQARSGDPHGQLRAFVDFDRRLYEQAGDVLRILAEARRQHPELGRAYDEGRRRGDEQRRRVFASWPLGAWREGVTVDRAVAVYGSLVSLDSFDTASKDYGWAGDEVAAWWHATLASQLLR